jgi:integrase
MRKLVMPAFEHLTLREIGVARCDALLKQLGQKSYARSKRAKTVMRLAFALAVRHEVIGRNPIDGVARLYKPKRTPTALTATEANAICAVIKAWEQARGTCGPNPDGQLGQIIEVMLGTSARIGEVLAIRRCDVDVTTTPATLRICGTLVHERKVGTYRQAHPKTDRSNRVVALPSFTAEALRRRLSVMADRSPEALVFQSREGTPLTTANVRRQLRKVLGDAGIEGVHPHMFRRTVATVVNERASVNLAAELLGHTGPKVTIEHYIRRNEHVKPADCRASRSGVRAPRRRRGYGMSDVAEVSRFRYTNAMTTKPLARDELWHIATTQHGFVTAQQATEAGIGRHALQMLVHRGTLQRAAHGVYRFPQYPVGEHDQLALAVLWTRVPEAALTHETALDCYGISDVNPNRIHVTVGKHRRFRRAGDNAYVVHYEDLDAKQVGWWQEIPTVTPATAIAQCIAFGTPTYLLRQAIERGHAQGYLKTGERDALTDLLEARHE